MTPVPTPPIDKDSDPTIGALVINASRDISTLISKEIELAKSELKVSFRHGGVGIGLFAVAGFLGLLAIIMLSVAFAYFLHMTGLDLAWCFLIVFGTYLLLAALPGGGVGGGDVRLAPLIGALLGWLGVAELVTGIAAGFLVGGLAAVLLLVLGRADRMDPVARARQVRAAPCLRPLDRSRHRRAHPRLPFKRVLPTSSSDGGTPASL